MTGARRTHRLLFLSHVLPYPPDRGVAIRTYHLLRALSREFDVTALCFYRWKGGSIHNDLEADLRALRELGPIEAFPIPQEKSRVRFLWDHARSVLGRRPYTHYLYDSSAYSSALERVLRNRTFDLVHADTLDLSRHFDSLPEVPIVCGHHNLDSQVLRRRADYEPSPWRAAYLRHQADLLEGEIRRWCERVTLNLTVSEEDRRRFRQLAPEGRFVVVPNGVDVESFRPADGSEEEGLVFVGGTTWRPNEDALDFFCESVLPRLRTKGYDPTVRWVGRCSDDEKSYYSEKYDVELTGYVDDIRPYVRSAACYIVPLRMGGGTRLKILDAWAMGKAVVSTSVGCEGLAARDSENILIRDDPEGIVEAIVNVLNDRQLRGRLGRCARRTAEDRYSWESIGGNLSRTYGALVTGAWHQH